MRYSIIICMLLATTCVSAQDSTSAVVSSAVDLLTIQEVAILKAQNDSRTFLDRSIGCGSLWVPYLAGIPLSIVYSQWTRFQEPDFSEDLYYQELTEEEQIVYASSYAKEIARLRTINVHGTQCILTVVGTVFVMVVVSMTFG